MTHAAARRSGPELRRSLGLLEVTASGVGIIIGAGIYVLIGAAAAHAGATLWAAFILAAILSALSGLSYAELSSMFPCAAAEYEFTRRAFPEWVAFVVGWVMIAGLVVAAATVSLSFASARSTCWQAPAWEAFSAGRRSSSSPSSAAADRRHRARPRTPQRSPGVGHRDDIDSQHDTSRSDGGVAAPLRYFVFVVINLTVILLRWKRPGLARPFAVAWSLGRLPVLPALALVSVLVITRLEFRAVWMGLGLPVIGLIVAVLSRASRRSRTHA